ncbi:MAG: FAD-dependent monooxygenase [Gemmatirosa sp.]
MPEALPPTLEQAVVTDATDDRWDVIVVGAGPAGALAAHRVARSGRRVLLLDRRRFPRDKTCGDALIPDAQACLARNGLLDRVRALAWEATRGEVHSPSRVRLDVDCPALTLPRRVLDATLAAAAVEAGASFGQAPVDDVRDLGHAGVEIHVPGRAAPLVARVGILATGAHVGLLERTGLLERRRASAVAIRAYVRSTHHIDRLVISFDRSILPGYAWIFPVGADPAGGWRYNVGCGVVLRDGDEAGPQHALRAMLDRFLADFPPARALVAAQLDREPARGALLRSGLTGARPWGGGALLAAGEAIGATFPLTGEGIGKAMETGELAADASLAALEAGTCAPLAAYPDAVTRVLRPRYRGYAIAERWIEHPWLVDLVLRRAARRPRVREALTGILHERVDPSRVFSLGGLTRVLVS